MGGLPRWLSSKRGESATPQRLVVVGCGLIGASIAQTARARWPRMECVGVDLPEVLHALLKRGVITLGASTPGWIQELRLGPEDIVVLAMPLAALPASIELAAGHDWGSGSPLWIDVASLKGWPVEIADRVGLPRFVGGHPMAGSARSGWAASSASLLRRRPFVLCSSAGSSRADLERAARFVQGLGACPRLMSAAHHDEVVALCSHLPHLLAQALMALGDGSPLREDVWALAAGSWRDATRVAASDPSLWSEVFTHNRTALAAATKTLLELLHEANARLCDPTTAASPIADSDRLAGLRRQLTPTLPNPALASEHADSA